MLAALLTCVAMLAIAIVADAPGWLYVLTITCGTFGIVPFVGNSLVRIIPESFWQRLRLSRASSRRLGVKCFNSTLTRIGWNKLVFEMRGDDPWNPRHMQAAAAGHGWGFLIHLVASVWACCAQSCLVAAILVVLGVLLHLYPVLLQIYVLTQLREHKIGR
ncbi:hypothetical protein [Corynebacterium gerontici]|uniref:Glycosyl-4,4'-diaponeurosporenoate acyltransferase n=1 Tax=Corynebacterium gerontici TaxID=2079234 RepID=A0A3G6J255_9CORY|nr:hypothetical protein [Corynebacterium gerontici]AZA12135.1 hypothetical protein CGERO_09220 [Corynebacterium gerontici]